MFQSWRTLAYVGPDQLTGIMGRADAPTLRAMADFFTHQAEQCRALAEEHERRTRDAENARKRRVDARRQQLRLGARLTVLARLHGGLDAALAHAGVPAEAGRWAHTAWQKERARARLRGRDLEMWKARLAGAKRAELAERHRLSERQVTKILAEVERRVLASL